MSQPSNRSPARWPAFILGLAFDLYNQCTPHFRAQARGLSIILLFTATLSSFIFALGITHSFAQGKWGLFLFVFTVTFGLVFFVDRTIATARRPRQVAPLRLLTILVLPLLGVILLDTASQEDAIHRVFDLQQDQQRTEIVAQQQQREQPLRQRQAALRAAYREIDSLQRADDERYIEETQGRSPSQLEGVGEIADSIKKANQEADVRYAEAKSRLRADSIQLAADWKASQQETTRQIRQLPTWEQVDLMDRINLLFHHLIHDGNWGLWLFSICWWLLLVALECLPLMGKFKLELDEYFPKLDLQKKLFQQHHEARITQQLEQQLLDLHHQFMLEMQDARWQAFSKRELAEMDQVMAVFKQRLNTLREFAAQNPQNDPELEGELREFAQEAFAEATTALHEITQRPYHPAA